MDDASASRLGWRSPPRNPASDQDVLQRDIDAVLDLQIDREFVVIRLTVLIQVFDDSGAKNTVNDVVGDEQIGPAVPDGTTCCSRGGDGP